VKSKTNKLGKKTVYEKKRNSTLVIYSYLIKGTNVSNQSVISVDKTKRLVNSVLRNR
jgi:hypothetical protein